MSRLFFTENRTELQFGAVMITAKRGDKVIVITNFKYASKLKIYVTEYIRKGSLGYPVLKKACFSDDYVIKYDEELFSFLKQKENLSFFRKTGLFDKLQID